MTTTALSLNIDELGQKLLFCYGKYLSSNGIVAGDDFYIIKIAEEFGELSAAFLGAKAQRPPHEGDSLAEEAADTLCQVLVMIAQLRLDIGPFIERKWLREIEEQA